MKAYYQSCHITTGMFCKGGGNNRMETPILELKEIGVIAKDKDWQKAEPEEQEYWDEDEDDIPF